MPREKNRLFWWILTILFVIYTGFCIAMENGYYESKLNEKTVLTSEKIKQFESDIKAGKEVDIKEYLETKSVNYSNGISKAGLNFSQKADKIMSSGIDNLVKFLSRLFGN